MTFAKLLFSRMRAAHGQKCDMSFSFSRSKESRKARMAVLP